MNVLLLGADGFLGRHLLPELWLDPFGPLLKNLPVLAGLTLLFYLERR